MINLTGISGFALSLMMVASSMGSPVLLGSPNLSSRDIDLGCLLCFPGIPIVDELLCKGCPPTSTLPDTTCGNKGLEYAITKHTFRNTDNPKFTSANVEFFKTAATIQTGTTSKVGFSNGPQANPYSVYGGDGIDASFIGVNHRGYFCPPKSGEYTVNANNVDDIVFVWVDGNAYNGKYTRANANLEVGIGQSPPGYKTILELGKCYAIRVLYLNSFGLGAVFGFTINSPDGTTLVDASADSPYIIKSSCDGKYPKYQDWSSETV